MRTLTIFFLIAGGDVWKYVVGIGTLLGIYAAYKRIMADQLVVALAENKRLKSDVARLLREAAIQIENVQQYQTEVDGLQLKVREQRATITEFELRQSNGKPK